MIWFGKGIHKLFVFTPMKLDEMDGTRNDKGPEGLWSACDSVEAMSVGIIREQLILFEPAMRDCYEAGVCVATLRGARHHEEDILLSALFLKRALNDFRSVWRLIGLGYTSQAAGVAAMLYENAMVVSHLSGNTEAATKMNCNKTDDLPWEPKQLAKLVAKRLNSEKLAHAKNADSGDYESRWREIYSMYKWLCKIKHPTGRSALHESRSTSLVGGQYVVMAAPDVRLDDVAVKATILMIAIVRLSEAIRLFSTGIEADIKDPKYENFMCKIESAAAIATMAFKSIGTPLPFDISDSALAKEWHRLKAPLSQS